MFEETDDYLPESSNLFNPHGPPSLGLNQRPPSYQGVPPGAVGAGVLGERYNKVHNKLRKTNLKF